MAKISAKRTVTRRVSPGKGKPLNRQLRGAVPGTAEFLTYSQRGHDWGSADMGTPPGKAKK